MLGTGCYDDVSVLGEYPVDDSESFVGRDACYYFFASVHSLYDKMEWTGNYWKAPGGGLCAVARTWQG